MDTLVSLEEAQLTTAVDSAIVASAARAWAKNVAPVTKLQLDAKRSGGKDRKQPLYTQG
jgi:hypothetical protein